MGMDPIDQKINGPDEDVTDNDSGLTFTVLKTLTRSKQSHAVHVEDNDFHRAEDTHQEQTEPRSACRRQ